MGISFCGSHCLAAQPWRWPGSSQRPKVAGDAQDSRGQRATFSEKVHAETASSSDPLGEDDTVWAQETPAPARAWRRGGAAGPYSSWVGSQSAEAKPGVGCLDSEAVRSPTYTPAASSERLCRRRGEAARWRVSYVRGGLPAGDQGYHTGVGFTKPRAEPEARIPSSRLVAFSAGAKSASRDGRGSRGPTRHRPGRGTGWRLTP